eukprot:403348928
MNQQIEASHGGGGPSKVGGLSKASMFCGKALRSVDRFGYPISLTYKNEQTFRSNFGGFMTMFSIIALLIYFSFMVLDVVNRERFILTETRYSRNLYLDWREFKFDLDRFDLALQHSYTGVNNSLGNIHQYFSVKYAIMFNYVKPNYTVGEWPVASAYQSVPTTRCLQTRFANQSLDDNSRWFCPDVSEFVFQGRYGALFSVRFLANLTYCDTISLKQLFPNLECKSREEADLIANETVLLISYLEQYIDIREFKQSPIKWSIQSLQYDLGDEIKMDYFQIAQNNLVLQDNWLASSFNNQNLTFSQVRKQSTNSKIKGTRDSWVEFTFFLDDSTTSITRTTYNLIDALTASGGFASIIILVFKLLTTRIQKILYLNSVMKKLYLYLDPQAQAKISTLMNAQGYQDSKQKSKGKCSDESRTDHSPYGKNGNKTKNQDFSNQDLTKQNKKLRTNEVNSQRELLNQKSITKGKSTLNESGGSYDSTQSKASLMKEKLKALKFFEYSYTDHIYYALRKFQGYIVCKKRTNVKDQLYEVGLKKLSKEFDLIRYFKKLRISESIGELTLSEFQRNLIPYFERNVLKQQQINNFNKLKTSLSGNFINDSQTNNSIKKLVISSKKSKVDQKILECLGLQEQTQIEGKNLKNLLIDSNESPKHNINNNNDHSLDITKNSQINEINKIDKKDKHPIKNKSPRNTGKHKHKPSNEARPSATRAQENIVNSRNEKVEKIDAKSKMVKSRHSKEQDLSLHHQDRSSSQDNSSSEVYDISHKQKSPSRVLADDGKHKQKHKVTNKHDQANIQEIQTSEENAHSQFKIEINGNKTARGKQQKDPIFYR